MLSQYMKNGALSARTKSMYGKRVTRAQYEALSSMHAMSDFMLYLKSETSYGDVFAGVNENMLYYGLIEALFRRDIYADYQKICSLAFGYDRKLMDFVLLRTEMMEILRFIMLLISGRQSDYVCGLPEQLHSRTKINFMDLASCADYPDLLEKLRGTRYYSVLSGFSAQPPVDYTRLEIAVTLDYFRGLLKIAEKTPDALSRDAMLKRIRVQTDMMNISRVKRMKMYYNYSPEDVEKNLIRLGRKAESPLIRDLIAADEDGVDAVLKKSRYSALAMNISDRGYEKTYYSLIYHNGVRVLYGSAPTVEIALAYLDLKEIEMRNLITIVEGIRYNVLPPKIMEYLVGW